MRLGSSFAAASARACAAILVALPLALPITGCGGNKADSTDPVKLSFVVMGCNRIQESDWEKTRAENPSSANLPQLRQTLADIAALNPVPPYVFFTGDLVLNQAQDNGATLGGQLNAWAQVYRSDPSGLSDKTTLVPLPGNHEMLQKVHAQGVSAEIPNPATGPVWVRWLSANGFDRFAGNGPTPAGPNPDQIADDQSKLTYSFTAGDVHFVLLNTDTLTTTGNIGWIAYNWIEKDIEKAQQDPRIRTIFVLGHKPIVAPPESVAVDAAIINPQSFQLNALLNRSSKVVAYLCAHAHEWEAKQLGDGRAVWQVVAGNAGSQLEPSWNPPGGPYFGFTLVKVYASGKVGLVDFARPAPAVYLEGPTRPAQPRAELVLGRRRG